MLSLVAGALAGFLVTVVLVFILPAKWGHMRAIVAALAGFAVALLISTYVK